MEKAYIRNLGQWTNIFGIMLIIFGSISLLAIFLGYFFSVISGVVLIHMGIIARRVKNEANAFLASDEDTTKLNNIFSNLVLLIKIMFFYAITLVALTIISVVAKTYHV